MLDEVLCREVSNLVRQLKFKPKIPGDHHVFSRLTASLWFSSMRLTIIGSASSSRRPILDRRQKVILNRYLGNTRYKASNKLIDIYLFSQHELKNPRISFNLLVSSFPWVVLPKIIDCSVICHERSHCQYPLLSLHKLALHSFLYLLYQRWCRLFRLVSHILKPRCQERPSSSLLR